MHTTSKQNELDSPGCSGGANTYANLLITRTKAVTWIWDERTIGQENENGDFTWSWRSLRLFSLSRPVRRLLGYSKWRNRGRFRFWKSPPDGPAISRRHPPPVFFGKWLLIFWANVCFLIEADAQFCFHPSVSRQFNLLITFFVFLLRFMQHFTPSETFPHAHCSAT